MKLNRRDFLKGLSALTISCYVVNDTTSAMAGSILGGGVLNLHYLKIEQEKMMIAKGFFHIEKYYLSGQAVFEEGESVVDGLTCLKTDNICAFCFRINAYDSAKDKTNKIIKEIEAAHKDLLNGRLKVSYRSKREMRKLFKDYAWGRL